MGLDTLPERLQQLVTEALAREELRSYFFNHGYTVHRTPSLIGATAVILSNHHRRPFHEVLQVYFPEFTW